MEKENLRKVIFGYLTPQGNKSIDKKGYFHSWGFELYETANSTQMYSVGIVEDVEGNIKTVNPEFIKFENWQ